MVLNRLVAVLWLSVGNLFHVLNNDRADSRGYFVPEEYPSDSEYKYSALGKLFWRISLPSILSFL